MADTTDAKLVKECLGGNSSAFEVLVEKYQKPVFNSALRMVGDYDEARDVAQTVFVKAYENLDRYDSKHKFFSWIYRMMVNESLNLIKRRRSQGELDGNMAESRENPEDQLQNKELSAQVQSALSSLKIDHMVVIVLRHFADLSHREMAFCLDIPDRTVKSRLHTARKLLGDILIKRGVTRYD